MSTVIKQKIYQEKQRIEYIQQWSNSRQRTTVIRGELTKEKKSPEQDLRRKEREVSCVKEENQ